jgi:hypothetical protein
MVVPDVLEVSHELTHGVKGGVVELTINEYVDCSCLP